MENLLRQSRQMCPFLKKTSPATLRSLSTSTRRTSPCGGTMSNLQILARRCPMMGNAMAIQAAKTGTTALGGVFGGVRGYGSLSGGKAKLHTSRLNHATVDHGMLRHRDRGMLHVLFSFGTKLMTRLQRCPCSMAKSRQSRNSTMW